MRTHRPALGALVGALLLTGAPPVHAAAPAPALQPAARPAKTLRLANPAGSAKAIAALGRFARGKLGPAPADRRVKANLERVKNGQAAALRLIEGIEAIPAADRARLFPGVAKVESLTTQEFDRAAYHRGLAEALVKAVPPPTTVLPPDPFDPKDKSLYELVYRGARCDATADADGVDEPVVYLNVISGANTQSPVFLPAVGAGTASAGALDTSSAGQVWASPSWPGAWNSGIVIVTAVLEDEGDLAQRKEELDLLLAFAFSEAEEDPSNPDRMEVLRREIDDALALLHLANPARWSPKAVQVRKLTSAEYDQLLLAPSTAAPVPHKLAMQHDPRGSSYTLFFDIPSPTATYANVTVTIKEVEALGADRDAKENKIADLGVTVRIDANTAGAASRTFARNRDLVKPGWRVERDVLTTSTPAISIHVFDDDPAPTCACSSVGGWPFSSCFSYCADLDVAAQCKSTLSLVSPGTLSYSGTCPRGQVDYDVDPVPDTGDGWLAARHRDVEFTLDLSTKKLAGDVSGAPGTFTAIGTDGAGNRARVVFEVAVK